MTDLLDRSPPVAVLTGFSGRLDEPLEMYARERGYDRVEGVVEGGAVYVEHRELTGPNLE
jgi:hypothetical protein